MGSTNALLIPRQSVSLAGRMETVHLATLDTGMMCAVRELNRKRLTRQSADSGIVPESFVYNELRKQAIWINEAPNFFHYRDKDKVEVDLIIENGIGDCFAVEVKTAATLSSKEFTGLKRFQGIAGERFKVGF